MTSPTCNSASAVVSCPRRNGSPRFRVGARSRLLFAAVAILASLTSTALASPAAARPQITAPAALQSPHLALDTSSQGLSQGSNIDAVLPVIQNELLRQRQAEDESTSSEEDERPQRTSTSADEESRTTSERSQRETGTPSGTPSKATRTAPTTGTSTQGLPTADASPSALPKPFDDAIANDFKTTYGDDSCPNFVMNLLSDPTFQRCYPLSMLIQSSRSFFNAQKQLLDIVRVLDRACSADVEFCTNWLDEQARNMRASENCGEELEASDTPLTSPVLQAYNGLRAYNTLYKATCLQDRDPAVDMYCYATAVTNTTVPSDGYLYFMPYGLNFPGSSTPSCNQCVSETMAIYHSASADRSQLISETYEAAAVQINAICGPNFVDPSLPPPDTSSGLRLAPSLLQTVGALCLGIALTFIL